MSLRVDHRDITWLAVDQTEIATGAGRDVVRTIREGIRVGGLLARDNAKRSAGKHGKWYPAAITWEMRSAFHGAAASAYQGEYGPDISKRQGEMSFEHGSRNQPPHNDLAKSADVIGPAFQREIGELVDGWFAGRHRIGR